MQYAIIRIVSPRQVDETGHGPYWAALKGKWASPHAVVEPVLASFFVHFFFKKTIAALLFKAHEAFHCELECCAILSGYLVRQRWAQKSLHIRVST